MSLDVKKLFFKYGVYYPVTLLQGGNLAGPLKALKASQFASRSQLEGMQLEKLQRLIRHAKTSVPWYQSAWHGLNPETISSLAQLSEMPLVAKGDIQRVPRSFRSVQNRGRLITKTSGGSTGQPLTVVKSGHSWINELAATWRGYSWAGVDIGDSQARFWGVPLDESASRKARLTDWICHRVRCSAFSFDEHDMQAYWEKLKDLQPKYFYGYVSMLVEFAEYIRRSGKDPGIRPHSIIATSEVLTSGARQLLESVFSTRVYNEYGCGEVGTIAHECEAGNLHLTEENMYVEIISEGQPCPPGTMGEIVVTELNNWAMPLIRYRMGDYGSLAETPCSCGRALRVLEGVRGRAYDFIYSSDGRRFHGEFMMYIFEDLKREGVGIRQFQVRQQDIGKFLIRIVPQREIDGATLDKVIAKIREHIDSDAQIEFETVEKIAREASGKMRVIVGMHRTP